MENETPSPVEPSTEKPLRKKIVWLETSNRLCQAFSKGVEFAFCAEKSNAQATQIAICKDYLQDAIQGALHNRKNTVFGFTYNPKDQHQPCLSRVRLLIANSNDKQLRDKIPNCVEFLNKFEAALGIPFKTHVKECFKPEKKYIAGGVFLFVGSVRWINAPVMLSLYTLLIRVGFGHKIGDSYEKTLSDIVKNVTPAYESQDTSYVKSSIKSIEYIVKHGDREVFHKEMILNYPPVDVSTMHGSMGIVAFSNESTKSSVPHWHRKLEKKSGKV